MPTPLRQYLLCDVEYLIDKIHFITKYGEELEEYQKRDIALSKSALEEQVILLMKRFTSSNEKASYKYGVFMRFFQSYISRFVKTKYSVGQIVYLNEKVIDLNWGFKKWIQMPFIVSETPKETKKIGLYKVIISQPVDHDITWKEIELYEELLQENPEKV